LSITANYPEELQELDNKMEELRALKRGFESRAIRAEDQADRMQFEDRYALEARRYYQIAADNREKAEKIQMEIDKLEIQKKNLHPK